jgi:hypothetical protein
MKTINPHRKFIFGGNPVMKKTAIIIGLLLCIPMCAPKQVVQNPDDIDEGTGVIQEDKVTEDNTPVVDDKSALADKSALEDRSKVLIKRYFDDDNTYVIVCKGFPKEGLDPAESRGTAREAALLNAQVIAKQAFKDSVDVIKNGRVEKYTDYPGYSVLYYVIKYPRLKKQLREENPFVD